VLLADTPGLICLSGNVSEEVPLKVLLEGLGEVAPLNIVVRLERVDNVGLNDSTDELLG
jgi:hypothetical protein